MLSRTSEAAAAGRGTSGASAAVELDRVSLRATAVLERIMQGTRTPGAAASATDAVGCERTELQAGRSLLGR